MLCLGLVGALRSAGLAAAQSPPAPATVPQSTPTNSAPALPPIPESPSHYLRRLLDLDAASRERELAKEPAELRDYWRKKLQEYAALSPTVRDTRLRAVQFRWELLALMKLSPTERAARWQPLSVGDRAFLQQRLAQWDALPAPMQHEILENETTVLYFLRLQSGSAADQERTLQTYPADYRRKLEVNLARWRGLSRARREQMLGRFNRFFELTSDERQQILNILPEPQRQQTQQMLQSLERLPKSQRQEVLEGLRKFANLTSAEREQFLQNAARWEALSVREREAWLNMMNELPPLPPGVEPMPPLPPNFGTPPLPPGLGTSGPP
ncbi:MAG: DUF3106 domain-containing protein [Verrucomicrobia bacterium]|nr:DUF3106 domain-containing protein [Verrucomicrobiota bacterium]